MIGSNYFLKTDTFCISVLGVWAFYMINFVMNLINLIFSFVRSKYFIQVNKCSRLRQYCNRDAIFRKGHSPNTVCDHVTF